jgi:hypothetical protein
MTFYKSYDYLRKIFNQKEDYIQVVNRDLEIHNLQFHSESTHILPGSSEYFCKKHSMSFKENFDYQDQQLFKTYPDTLKSHDIDIPENQDFTYSIFKKNIAGKADRVIFLFHGLSEKYWDKYLPWAEKLVELTNSCVVLFPIAFHMNRAPLDWSNSRLMNQVAQTRKTYSPAITNSTFANAAISARIQMIPQRFFWSGLQTYYDVIKLIDQIRSGNHPLIESYANFNIFSYSIGSFLSEILLMSNPKNYFDNSKLFIFCGGPTVDRMFPNSKFILDSDATISIYSFYIERLESELKLDKRLSHYFSEDHLAGKYFRSMLSYQKNKEFREDRLRELSGQIYAVALKKDEIIPPNEVLNVLKGDYRDIKINVDILDFPFHYDHINPFALQESKEQEVNNTFQNIFRIAAQYLH